MHSPTVSVPHAFSDPLAACMWIVRQASKGVYSPLLNGMDCHSCSRFWANAALVSLCLLAGIEGTGGKPGVPERLRVSEYHYHCKHCSMANPDFCSAP